MTRKDVLIIQAPFLMTKENIEKTYNQFIKQMESGLLMLPSGYTVIQCPKDIDVKFSGDAISREWLKTAIHNFYYGLQHIPTEEDIQAYMDAAPSVSTEKTDAYKQGWHDAITTALKETHSVHTEEGHFRVVQEETLIGVGMAYEQVSTEKTGRWITWKEAGNEIPSETRFECSVCHDAAQTLCNGLDLLSPYCPNCGCRMEVEE